MCDLVVDFAGSPTTVADSEITKHSTHLSRTRER